MIINWWSSYWLHIWKCVECHLSLPYCLLHIWHCLHYWWVLAQLTMPNVQSLHIWHCSITYSLAHISQCQLCSRVSWECCITHLALCTLHTASRRSHNAKYAVQYRSECHAYLALCTMPFMSAAHLALCHYIRPCADLTMPIMQYSVAESVMHIWHCA